MAISLVMESRTLRERTRSFAIAMLSEAEFHRLKSRCPALQLPDRYNDWLDEREGLLVGLSAAGMRTIPVPVDPEKFLAWSAADAIALDEAALDRFAASTQGNANARSDLALLVERASGPVAQRIGSFN